MYAAAGGASLASRQARQRQRQNRKNEKQAQLKNKTPVAPALQQPLKPPQSKQFHNLSPNYQASTLMLSRVERNALKPPAPVTERRHSSTQLNHLKEPPRARIRESPSILIPVQNHCPKQHLPKSQPLTPTTLVQNHIPFSPSFALPQILVPETEPGKENERRCSLVRQCEEAEKCEQEPDKGLCLDLKDRGPDGNPLLYSELDRSFFGSLEYPLSEVLVLCFDCFFLYVMSCS